MNITLTNQVQRLKQELIAYVTACTERAYVTEDAGRYFIDALKAMPTVPHYALTGLSGVGTTTILELLLGRIAANCPPSTIFMHEQMVMTTDATVFLHDLDTLQDCLIQYTLPNDVPDACNMVLWVTQYGNIGSVEEQQYLQALKEAGKAIICVVNMIDIHEQLTNESLEEHVIRQLQPLQPYITAHLCISAAYAKAAQEFYDDELYIRSGFHLVEQFFEEHEYFYVQQLEACWMLFEPFIEYIEAIMRTSVKDVADLVHQAALQMTEMFLIEQEQAQQLHQQPLEQFLPPFETSIRAYMAHEQFQQGVLKQATLQVETLFAMPATVQELEDVVGFLLQGDAPMVDDHHIYVQLQRAYQQVHALLDKFARTQKAHMLANVKQEQVAHYRLHEDIVAYDEAYAFHTERLTAIEAAFQHPLHIDLMPAPELQIDESRVVLDDAPYPFSLPFTFERFVVEYMDEQLTFILDEVSQQLEASASILAEMDQIAQSANEDAQKMRSFQERLEQAETINELLLLFDGQLEDNEYAQERFELFHELIESYRVMQAKIDVYDEQALQTLMQHEQTYKAIIAHYRHLALLTNADKRELRAIVQDYNGIQAFRKQQYEELARAYEDLDNQATEHKQMLIREYDRYMRLYKEQLQQRESVMNEWQQALEERQQALVKRDRLRVLQHIEQSAEQHQALQPLVRRITDMFAAIEAAYDYDMPQLPTYEAKDYNTVSIKDAAIPVEQEYPQFAEIQQIATKYEVVPYRGIIITGVSVITMWLLFSCIYAVLYATGFVDIPLSELFGQL